MKSVFVTGATGFVGGALLPRLCAEGFDVHALARASSDRGALADLPITWHAGDLSDPASIAAAIAAAGPLDLCIHGGATISYRTADAAVQERVNVDGTRAVLESARQAGIARIVHVGSVVAVGTAPDGSAVLDEDAPWDPRLERVDYVRTKRRADELAVGLGAVVVDPGAIFGPGALRANTTKFLGQVRRRGAPPLVPPGGLSVVGVGDVADGILAAARRGAPGRRYLLCESNWSLRAIFTAAAPLFGHRRRPLAAVPRPLWRGVVAGARAVDSLRPLDLLAPQGLSLVAEHYRFDARRARAELDWSPRPFTEVLRETADWLESADPGGELA